MSIQPPCISLAGGYAPAGPRELSLTFCTLLRKLEAPVVDWYFIAEQPAPAPHLAHSEGCAALRIVLVTVPRVSRFREHFSDGLDLHLPRR